MRNLSKILLALLCMALCLTACAEKEAATAGSTVPTVAADTTYTGTISALSLTHITVQTESGDIVIALAESTVYTRNFDADALQPPQNGDDFVGGDIGTLPEGDMGTLPEGDIPNDPIGGVLPPDGNFGGMGGMGDMGGMGGMGDMGDMGDALDRFLGEASIYDLCLGMSVTVTTDEASQAATILFTQNDLMR